MPRTIVKEGPNFKIYSNGEILLQNVRFSYPHLAEPYKKPEDPTAVPKFTIVGLAPKAKNAALRTALKEHVDDMCAKWKGGIAVGSKDKFLRNGDDTAKEENKGMFTINASSAQDRQPSVRGKDTKPIKQEKIATAIQGGYWGDILIKPWIQDNKHGKKVNAELIAVQLKDDSTETFGQPRTSEDEIDEIFEGVDETAPEVDEDDDLGGL